MHGKGLQSALARSNARVWARNKLTMVKQAQAALEDGAGGGCEVRIVRVLEDPHGKLHALLPQLWRGGRAVQACGDGLRGVERGTVSGSLDTPHAVEAGSSAHLERVRKVVCSGYALAEQAQQGQAYGARPLPEPRPQMARGRGKRGARSALDGGGSAWAQAVGAGSRRACSIAPARVAEWHTCILKAHWWTCRVDATPLLQQLLTALGHLGQERNRSKRIECRASKRPAVARLAVLGQQTCSLGSHAAARYTGSSSAGSIPALAEKLSKPSLRRTSSSPASMRAG